MITNPYPTPSTSFGAWANGFFSGLTGPSHSIAAPADIAPPDVDAFNAGVLAGQQSAVDGISLSTPCVSAMASSSEAVHVLSGAEILHGLWEMRSLKTLGMGLAGIFVALVELAVTLPEDTLPPEQVLPDIGQKLVDELNSYGVGPLEIFCGAGSDVSQDGCEIKLTPVFTSLEQAHDAAIALGRAQWVVASWRTDTSDSFRLVDQA